MSFENISSRPQESSVLALATELHNLYHLLKERSLEHQLMLVAKWQEPHFVIEVTVFSADGHDNDLREETESDLNTSFLLADEEDLNNLFDSVIDMMPSIDTLSEDTSFDIRAHAARTFEQMQSQVKGSMGVLRLGMDVNFNHDLIEFNRWTAFATEQHDGFSIIEEHKLFHSFGVVASDEPQENLESNESA